MTYLFKLFGVPSNSNTELLIPLIAVVLLILHTTFNLLGVKVTGIITKCGFLGEVSMTLLLSFVLLITPPHQDFGVIFSRQIATGHDAPWYDFLPATLCMAFVFYGFESAADVSEEVVGARKTVPRAILFSLIGTACVTFLLCFSLIWGIPNIPAAAKAREEATYMIIEAHVGSVIARLLCIMLVVSFVACNTSTQAAISRQLFSFARGEYMLSMKILTFFFCKMDSYLA